MGQGVIKQPSRRPRGCAEGGVEFRSFLFEALNAAMLSPSVAMLSARILAAVPRFLSKEHVTRIPRKNTAKECRRKNAGEKITAKEFEDEERVHGGASRSNRFDPD